MRRSLVSILAITLVSVGSSAFAAKNITREGFFFSPYIGADYDYTHLTDTPTGVESDYNGYNVHAGLRLHRNFGFEAGYFATDKGKGNVSGFNVETDFEGANIDFMGYLPVTNDFEFIGSLGAAYTHGKVSVPGIASATGTDWDARYGLGMQYWFTDNINARTMVHYANDTDGGSDTFNASAGINIGF